MQRLVSYVLYPRDFRVREQKSSGRTVTNWTSQTSRTEMSLSLGVCNGKLLRRYQFLP